MGFMMAVRVREVLNTIVGVQRDDGEWQHLLLSQTHRGKHSSTGVAQIQAAVGSNV
jgi:hypothetical protein